MSYASTAVNGVKQATTTTAYANAVKNLSLRQTELALSTKNLSVEQQREILVTAGLIKETGTLTVAQATEAFTTDTRNAADVEALMLKAGLITELGAETTATITVDAAKLKELVDTKVLTQAEAELLAMKAGVTLQSTKEAATLIASNAKLGSSFAIMGKTAGAALKGIGTGLLSFASAHPLIAALVGVVSIVGLVTTGTKKLREEQEQAIETARSLQEEYRSSTKSLSDNISSLESQKDEFERLSKGVDDYGKNISLSSDEYDRYKSIMSEILGYSPELIQGYDAEGNAIANKNSLIERSIELMKEEQRQKLKEMTTDEKTKTAYEGAKADWQQTKGYEGANTRNDIAFWFRDNADNYEREVADVLGIKTEYDDKTGFGTSNAMALQNAIIDNIDVVAEKIKEKKSELLALTDMDGNALFTEAEIDAMIDQADTWQQQYADWQRDIEDAKHGMDDQFELYAQKADGYNDLTDAQKAFVNEYIKATGDIIDADGNLLSEDEIIKKAEGYTKFVEKLANDPNFEEARTKINTLFSLDKSKIPASEYEKQVNAILKELQDKFNLTDDEVMDFKIALGFTFTSDGKTQTGKLLDQVKGKLKDEFDGKADELTLEELQIAARIVADIPEGILLSWDELQDKIKETQGNANKMTVSLSEMKSASDSISALSSAFKQLSDDGYLTTESISKIQEATQLSGNVWEEYQNKLIRAKAGSSEFNQVMSELTHKILENKFGTIDLTNATEEEISAIEDKIEATLRENNVANASAIAQEFIAKKKAQVQIQNRITKDGIDSVIEGLKDETNWCGLTANAYAQLVAKEIIFNNNDLDVSGKLTKLQSLYGMLGLVGYKWEYLNNAMSDDPVVRDYARIKAGIYKREGQNRQYEWVYNNVAYSTEAEAFDAYMIDQINKDITVENTNPVFTNPDLGKDNTPDKPEVEKLDYSDYYDEILSDKQKARERYEDENDKLQRELEQAIEDKNLNEVNRIVELIKKNNAEAVEQLNTQLGTSQTTLNDEILPLIYGIAPELQVEGGWDAVTDVQKEAIREKYKKAILEENNRWEEQSYDILSKNGNKQNEVYKQAEADHNKAIEKLEYESDMFDQLVDSADSYVEDIKEIPGLVDEWNDKTEEAVNNGLNTINDIFDEYQRHVDRTTKALEEQAEAYDILINKGQALVDAERKMYDAQANVREIQRDIAKELRTNKAMAEYLDEETRKRLFNEDDYNTLDQKLTGISEDIGEINAWYNAEISKLTKNNWYLESAITAEYERRLESKQKEYEIARAELDLEKKKLELNNILNERNIRMLTKNDDGSYEWKYVHNTEEASRVVGEIADLEGQIAETRLQAEQDAALATKQAKVDQLNAEQAAINNQIDQINKHTKALSQAIEDITNPLQGFGSIVSQLNSVLETEITALDGVFSSVTGGTPTVISTVSGSSGTSKTGGAFVWAREGKEQSVDIPMGSTAKESIKIANDIKTEAIAKRDALLNSGAAKNHKLVQTYQRIIDKAERRENTLKSYADDADDSFDHGGIAEGKGFMFKDTNLDELVLDPQQTDYFKNFVKNMDGFDVTADIMSKMVKNIPSSAIMQKYTPSETYEFNGDIVLPNVTKPEDFMKELKRSLQQNSFKK